MLFDFCICENPVEIENIKLDTIFYIIGDETYMTPHKSITPNKIYFLYTLRGEGVVRYDGKTFAATANTFIFMAPNQTFSYWSKGDYWEFWWFEFTGDCPWETDKSFSFPCNHLSSALMAGSLQYAKSDEWEIASSLFLSLAKLLAHGAAQSKKLASNELVVNAAEEYIRQHIDSVTVEELADTLGVQERTLRNIFYNLQDMSPKHFITKIRMDMAGYMLSSTNISLAEIALSLGFSSRYHLGKSFKEHFGVTPIKYRKLIHLPNK